GMEQIGWNGESKPLPMYSRKFTEKPSLPQISEGDEVEQARAQGVDLHSGVRTVETGGEYDVDGVLLKRPFKIVRIGPIRLFVRDLDSSEAFYTRQMGFAKTEEVTWEGQRCIFLRGNTEHHSLALYPVHLREALGLRPDTSCLSFGLQLGSYRQLREAVVFLRQKGCTVRELPSELFPGMGHSAFVFDPDGHAVQLYAYMEQIGWDGRPRPAHLRPRIEPGVWPETLPALADCYGGEAFLGPLG
ncbi:MAG: VOC family protein, partial [Chloroflexota bacterium]|nr:VOC family protein [Chloroflexota bacterium]